MDRQAVPLFAALLGVLAASALIWMFQGIGGGNRGFILQLRGVKLAGLVAWWAHRWASPRCCSRRSPRTGC
ncbi:MAG TPA: hypothetical protein PLL33_04925 [Paracoccus sp. (in: a-proteobacteria)]|nr:hypothetical protein [Paracoccus sp. (in: a-proteobacteria)]